MDELTNVVSTLGFPIAVAIFALWNSRQHEKYLQEVLETTLKENTKAIESLSDTLDKVFLFMKGSEDK